jgi:iron-sulfur cluster repair protein YtfE (RIC family)
MATFPNSFRTDSARIHGEHQELLTQLADLISALEALGPSTLSVDPLGAGRLRRSASRLEGLLPAHFRREEATLLDAVAPVSPELAEFARQMRQEHQRFTARMSAFVFSVAELESGNHGGSSLRKVQETGEVLAHDLAEHIALEEHQLDGFL